MLLSGADQVVSGGVYPGRMSWIDVAIAALVVISALRGWSQGVLRQLGGILGRVAGFVVGCYLAADVTSHVSEVAWRPFDAILVIIACTVAGGLVLRVIAGFLSRRLHEGHLGVVDSVLGASVGVVGTLITCWLLAAVVAAAPWSSVGHSISHSVILRSVQRVLPSPPAVESRLQGVLDQVNVPSLFANVIAPTLPDVAHNALGVTHFVPAPAAVVNVEANGSCHLFSQGSGFVVAPGEVVTAAHLIAGERTVRVDSVVGRVVLFDARTDLAVIRAPGLAMTPLSLGAAPSRGSLGDVVGFVASNDRTWSAAVYLGSVVAPGRDIYSGPVFSRTMDLVSSRVTASEAGAPVLVHGAVVGVVAQRAVAGSHLLYAVPVDQLREQLSRVTGATVSTQRCVN